jgi:cystathionine beta-lyase/cystathionine gamma-synthase
VTFGATLAPFDAWLTERGLGTFSLRFAQQCQNAFEVARYLVKHQAVKRVYYPGLPEHHTHTVATRVLNEGFGAMVSFELYGGYDAANRFVQETPGIPFAPSLGGVKTSLSHPQLTSHRMVPPEEQQRLGITPGLLRLSVGVEPITDIQNQLDAALRSL